MSCSSFLDCCKMSSCFYQFVQDHFDVSTLSITINITPFVGNPHLSGADPGFQLDCIKIGLGVICKENQTLEYLKNTKITTLLF